MTVPACNTAPRSSPLAFSSCCRWTRRRGPAPAGTQRPSSGRPRPRIPTKRPMGCPPRPARSAPPWPNERRSGSSMRGPADEPSTTTILGARLGCRRASRFTPPRMRNRSIAPTRSGRGRRSSTTTAWHRRNRRALGGADNRPGLAGLGYSVALSLREPGADGALAGRGTLSGLRTAPRLPPLAAGGSRRAAGGGRLLAEPGVPGDDDDHPEAGRSSR